MDTNNETVPEGCNASSDYPWGLRENCFSLLDLQRLPLGIARKIAITKKKKKQQAHDGRWEEGKDVSFWLPPSHRPPRAFILSLSPASLRHNEASAE